MVAGVRANELVVEVRDSSLLRAVQAVPKPATTALLLTGIADVALRKRFAA